MKFKKITSGKSYGIMYDTRYTFKNRTVNQEQSCSVTIDNISINSGNMIINMSYEGVDTLKLNVNGDFNFTTGLISPTSQIIVNKLDYSIEKFTDVILYGYLNGEECAPYVITLTEYGDTNFNVSAVYDLAELSNFDNHCSIIDAYNFAVIDTYSGTTYNTIDTMVIEAFDDNAKGGLLSLLYCNDLPVTFLRIFIDTEEIIPTSSTIYLIPNTSSIACKSGKRTVNIPFAVSGNTVLSGTTFVVDWTGDDIYDLQNNSNIQTIDKINYTVSVDTIAGYVFTFTIVTPDPGCTVTGDISLTIISSDNVDIMGLPVSASISF